MFTVEEVSRLISIPSETGKEAALGRYLNARFAELGFDTALTEVAPGRHNVLALSPGSRVDRLELLFHGHLDTVAAHGMQEPYSASIRDGAVWGRGSVDQKGGIAAVICAFAEVIRSGNLPHKGFAFVGVIDEEAEHRGSMALQKTKLHARHAVVTEPSSGRLVLGCKGTLPLQITVLGKASHGCRPWLGVNAVEYGMKIASELLAEELPAMDIEGIGTVKGSLNLGLMSGGTAYNIVPDLCRMCFDRRLLPGEDLQSVLRTLKQKLARYGDVPGLEVRLDVDRPDWNWEPIKQRGLKPTLIGRKSEIVQIVNRAYRKVTGKDPIVYFTDGYSEADFLVNDMGIPTVHYGPGDSGLCHTNEERLDIAQLDQAVAVYTEIIQLTCGEGP